MSDKESLLLYHTSIRRYRSMPIASLGILISILETLTPFLGNRPTCGTLKIVLENVLAPQRTSILYSREFYTAWMMEKKLETSVFLSVSFNPLIQFEFLYSWPKWFYTLDTRWVTVNKRFIWPSKPYSKICFGNILCSKLGTLQCLFVHGYW